MFRKCFVNILPFSKFIFVLLQAYLLIRNRERYITSLVSAGYLQMTNPDNPTASNQKYKKYNQVLSLQWDISNIDCNKIYAKEDFAEK